MQAERNHLVADVAAMLAEPGSDLAIVDRALEALCREHADRVNEVALLVLCEVASRGSGRELRTVDELAAWLLGLGGGAPLARLLLTSAVDEPSLEAIVLLIVARRVVRVREPSASLEFSDAPVVALDRFLVDHWKRSRAESPHEWLYHPRRTSISGLVVRKLLADLMTASPKIREDAERGSLACDLNVVFAVRGRNKTLDCVLGRPRDALSEAIEPANPLRKARLDEPIITIEVKACMTSHRQANSRLVDELHSSVEVVKAQSRLVIPVAIVIVNVAPTFTNPLNLPGPNKHVPAEVARLFERLVHRVPVDPSTGTEIAYGGLAIVVVDTDNERRIREGVREGRVPPTHTYERTVGRVASLYERLTQSR